VCVSHNGVSVPTTRLLVELERLGAAVSLQQGTADLAGGRNAALNAMAARPADACDVVLCIDDDIVATPLQAMQVTQIPDGYAAQSARYVRQDGALAAWPRANNRWHTGFGLLAVRHAVLKDMRACLPSYRRNGETLAVYAQCGPGPTGTWRIDDESFCDNLEPWGGVALSEVKVGHQKTMVLWA
jgi:hypothetical protein